MSIKDNSNAVRAEANRLIKAKLKVAATLVERTAKLPGYCPVKTGHARRTITHKMMPDGKSVKVGSNVDYFPYIEMGTRFMNAYAPLRRALETNMGRIKRLFGAK